MVKGLTIDSSIIISSLVESETRHKEAFEIWDSVLSGKHFAVMPYSVLVEVVSAVRRRTGSEKLALDIKKELLGNESISFVILDDKAAEDAAEIAAKLAVRGMDAIVIQVAKEFSTKLMTFDKEMQLKAAKVLPKI